MQMFSPASRDTALRTAPTCLTIISDVLFHALSTQHGNEMSRTSTYHTGFPDSDPTTVVSPRFAQTSNAHDQIAPNHNARSRSEAHCLDMYLDHCLSAHRPPRIQHPKNTSYRQKNGQALRRHMLSLHVEDPRFIRRQIPCG